MVIYSIHLKHWSGGSVPHSLIKGWRFNPSPLIHWYVSGVPNQLTKDWGFETDIFLKVQAMQGSGYVSCLHRLSFVKKKKKIFRLHAACTYTYISSFLFSIPISLIWQKYGAQQRNCIPLCLCAFWFSWLACWNTSCCKMQSAEELFNVIC